MAIKFLRALLSGLPVLLLNLLLITAPTIAQTEVNGAIRGQIADPNQRDKKFVGVVVQILNLATQVKTATKVNPDGTFFKDGLNPGIYLVTVRVPGYAPFEKNHRVEVMRTRDVPPVPIFLTTLTPPILTHRYHLPFRPRLYPFPPPP